ncbi:MAG TPA: N-acetylmuramoyl-L-alanine amidase [Stellaceae bacterium]|nr:N-acetylmuramoyl-L-alanine amidase [Stellaceae bacterium]
MLRQRIGFQLRPDPPLPGTSAMQEIALSRRRILRLLGGFAGGSAAAMAMPALARVPTPPRKPTPPKQHRVVLDPGHGGIDPGAIGVSGIFEKEITLATAEALARSLEATKRYKVVLTRTTDEFVELEDRVARAREAQGDLFLSIHADAIPDSSVRGASVFTLSERASDAEAAALAQRENKVDLLAGIDLSRHTAEVGSILLDLARRQTNNLSLAFARRLVAELGREVRMLNNSHRSAGFVVLKAPDIPSALVELGCLSNTGEEKELRSDAYRDRLVISLAHSINDYFDQPGAG